MSLWSIPTKISLGDLGSNTMVLASDGQYDSLGNTVKLKYCGGELELGEVGSWTPPISALYTRPSVIGSA
jgi:hypothetical protein